MSGEDERSRRPTPEGGGRPARVETPRPAAGNNPFLDEAPPGPAKPKAKRGKPPPGIISAGGVDMARAHASNIRPVAESEQKPVEQAKVVLKVESDPRRMRTMPRMDGKMLEGMPPPGESPWAKGGAEVLDKAALPSANIPKAAVASDQKKEEDKPIGGFWLRAATAVVVLLLLAGVAKRVYVASKRNAAPPPTPYAGGPLIPPPLPDTAEADTAEPSATGAHRTGTARPVAPGDTSAAVDPSAEPLTDPSAEASAAAPTVRVRPPPPPPPPKPTFTPLFELPNEKKN